MTCDSAEHASGSARADVSEAEVYRRLCADLALRRERATDVRRLLVNLEEQIARDEEVLREYAPLAHADSNVHELRQRTRLGGRALADTAVEVLGRRVGPEHPTHYRAWYRMVTDEGHQVAGKEPLATFLSQLQRDPRIRSLGGRTGLYELVAAELDGEVRARSA